MMRSNPEVVFSLIALALAALIGFAVRYWIGLSPYWVWLVAAYSVAFAVCRFDKRRAKVEGATRVPEVVLLGLMWVGGVLGAAFGMFMRPHHKTKQMRFVISLVAASILYAALLIWWII